MVLGAITRARVSGPAEFKYRVDTRVCMLVNALSVWTVVSEYTQPFGVPALDLKS